mmetsp:Transcript_53989/g.114686  ORF Transcript_53989/g.114686 Transcript_53989/m.114686 type:complete len:223 (-) Transcript_53989:868-1536(-)
MGPLRDSPCLRCGIPMPICKSCKRCHHTENSDLQNRGKLFVAYGQKRVFGFPPGQVPMQHEAFAQDSPEAAQLPPPPPPLSTQLPSFGLPSHVHKALSLQVPLLPMEPHTKRTGASVGARVVGAVIGEVVSGVVGWSVGAFVRATGESVGFVVGDVVGLTVNFTGAAVGVFVGNEVGPSVVAIGDVVGLTVNFTGAVVGVFVGDNVVVPSPDSELIMEASRQ